MLWHFLEKKVRHLFEVSLGMKEWCSKRVPGSRFCITRSGRKLLGCCVVPVVLFCSREVLSLLTSRSHVLNLLPYTMICGFLLWRILVLHVIFQLTYIDFCLASYNASYRVACFVNVVSKNNEKYAKVTHWQVTPRKKIWLLLKNLKSIVGAVWNQINRMAWQKKKDALDTCESKLTNFVRDIDEES